MFREGEWYTFHVTKVIDVPGGGKHFILTHESGKKILLPAKYYDKYNIIENTQIRCRVDKVNCTGQVFIEPEHPVYRMGKTYSFRIIQILPSVFSEADTVKVSDVFGNDIEILVPKGSVDVGEDSIDMKVIAIKKGIPVLTAPRQWSQCAECFEIGQNIELYLHSTIAFQGEDYYLLKTKTNCIALLKVKHYKHYGFNSDRPVLAKYRGIDDKGILLIDPEHPYYKEGGLYTFQISAMEEDFSSENGMGKVAVVFDRFGMKCGVKIENDQSFMIGDIITCKVLGYKKGRPLLEIVPRGI
ncbi:MAG: hypothetical protein AB1777_10105 [Bacteroidota bacterium]